MTMTELLQAIEDVKAENKKMQSRVNALELHNEYLRGVSDLTADLYEMLVRYMMAVRQSDTVDQLHQSIKIVDDMAVPLIQRAGKMSECFPQSSGIDGPVH